jgi:transaldolase/glucose-6-phosphate isomerase
MNDLVAYSAHLPDEILSGVEATLRAWDKEENVRKLWDRNSSLWTGQDEREWLGWLDVGDGLPDSEALQCLAGSVRREGFTHILLLGMGGSSLAADVLSKVGKRNLGWPALRILDSTLPAQIHSVRETIDLAHTLFIVASKSGTTLEPNVLMAYFLDLARQELGPEGAGAHFIAITDPGSRLEDYAAREGFRDIFRGVKSIGGRYSALSPFGIVPAALTGLDTGNLLHAAARMLEACSPGVPVRENPGALLGIILGVSAREGRDKVTFIASPDVAPLGAWLEQLLAESTGKGGKGIIPVDGEAAGPPEVYENDRLFVCMRSRSSPEPLVEQALWALEKAGHPVVRVDIEDAANPGGEFFRWMFATAVAGAVMGVNPFDQPDVEAAKVAARDLTAEYERTGTLPAAPQLLTEAGVTLFADPGNAEVLAERAGAERSLRGYLKAHLDRLDAGDYFALLAYLAMTPEVESILEEIRIAVRDRRGVATCVGFGPRYLHSTGQVYKGGPASGVFLQIVAKDTPDIPIPGERLTFGVVKAAQAGGDFEVLARRGRRILGVYLGEDTRKGLVLLAQAVLDALA